VASLSICFVIYLILKPNIKYGVYIVIHVFVFVARLNNFKTLHYLSLMFLNKAKVGFAIERGLRLEPRERIQLLKQGTLTLLLFLF
jgi:hypothetical protein